MQTLFLEGNQLAALPESLRRCERLTGLFLHENDALGIPPEVLGPEWAEYETRLMRDYPNIQGFIQTSCSTGQGIAQLRREIGKHVRRLPHVFDELPKSYFAVKAELERTAKNKAFIAVQGDVDSRRERLAVVRDAFRYVHGTIPALKPKEEVPLPDKPEVTVSYPHLLKLEKARERTYFPEGAEKSYAVVDLLSGVDSALYRLRRHQDRIRKRKEMGEKHVFVSYCHDNKDDVARLVEDLENEGEAMWWDEDILGGRDWKEAIREAMENAYAVVVCLSPELAKRYRSGVYPEIRDAIETFRQYGPGHAFIFPVRLAECEAPPIEIDDTRTLKRIRHIDLFPGSKRSTDLRKLVASLTAAPEHP